MRERMNGPAGVVDAPDRRFPADHTTGRMTGICYVIGAVLIASGLFHLGVLLVTGGSWEGPVSWRKPATFGLSFGLTLITIAWVASYVPLGRRTRTGLLGAFLFACVLEVVLITVQAWRRVPSHFNLETVVDGLVARVLAGGGAVLIAVIAVLTVASWRPDPTVAPSMRLAVRAGLVALDVALLVGASMIATGVARVAAGDQQGAYAAGGALKPTRLPCTASLCCPCWPGSWPAPVGRSVAGFGWCGSPSPATACSPGLWWLSHWLRSTRCVVRSLAPSSR